MCFLWRPSGRIFSSFWRSTAFLGSWPLSPSSKPSSCFFFFKSWVLHLFFFSFKLWVYLFIYLFIHLWLCWVLASVQGLSLVAASGGHSSSRCAGPSLSRPLFLRSTGSRRAGSAIVAHGPSRSAACGIFPDQGSNPCPLHWQADSQPLHHQGSPKPSTFNSTFKISLLPWHSCLPFIRLLWFHWAHLDNLGYSSHLKILNHICRVPFAI